MKVGTLSFACILSMRVCGKNSHAMRKAKLFSYSVFACSQIQSQAKTIPQPCGCGSCAQPTATSGKGVGPVLENEVPSPVLQEKKYPEPTNKSSNFSKC